MRMLMVASVASMIGQFNMENIRTLLNLGYDVEVAANFLVGSSCSDDAISDIRKELSSLGVTIHHVDFSRSAFSLVSHFRTYQHLRHLLYANSYSFVHCHAPIASAIVRLAAYATRTPVMYTAHGFHFFKGARPVAWLTYYPLELLLSRITDTLITINAEDYNLAKAKMHMSNLHYVPGVGIDCKKISQHGSLREKVREELGVGPEDIVLMSVGELNRNKNHKIVLEAMRLLNNDRIKYFIVGQGLLRSELEQTIAQDQLSGSVVLLGYRDDVYRLLAGADIFVLPSLREGLCVAGLEAMAAGLPIIGSKIRGVEDYVADQRTGLLCNPYDKKSFAGAIRILSMNAKMRDSFGDAARQDVASKFSIGVVNTLMQQIYRGIGNHDNIQE